MAKIISAQRPIEFFFAEKEASGEGVSSTLEG
jgi:hypothetical protein